MRRTIKCLSIGLGVPSEAPLGDEEDGLASSRVLGEEGADELLVVTLAIDVGRVDSGAAL